MNKFTYNCSIDGQDYSLELLAAVRYHRDLHVLHEMKRAGANVVHDGKTLSDDDINLLGAEEAYAVYPAYDGVSAWHGSGGSATRETHNRGSPALLLTGNLARSKASLWPTGTRRLFATLARFRS